VRGFSTKATKKCESQREKESTSFERIMKNAEKRLTEKMNIWECINAQVRLKRFAKVRFNNRAQTNTKK